MKFQSDVSYYYRSIHSFSFLPFREIFLRGIFLLCDFRGPLILLRPSSVVLMLPPIRSNKRICTLRGHPTADNSKKRSKSKPPSLHALNLPTGIRFIQFIQKSTSSEDFYRAQHSNHFCFRGRFRGSDFANRDPAMKQSTILKMSKS